MSSGTETPVSLAELAGLRRATYRLFGLLFHHPGEAQLAQLPRAAEEMRQYADLASDFAFYHSWLGVLDLAASLPGGDAPRLQEEYVGLFEVASSHPPCPLNESAYLGDKGRLAGWVMSDVERSYAAGGLALSGSAGDEPADHAGLELEFMSLLCAGEAEAWEAERAEQAADVLVLEKAFLEQHLRRWFPRLARRLRSVAAPESTYPRVADAALAFVVHDADLVGALAEEAWPAS